MKKIKNIYLITEAGTIDGFSDASKGTHLNYATGLILEAADSSFYAQLSTDAIQPFAEVRATKTLDKLIADLSKENKYDE